MHQHLFSGSNLIHPQSDADFNPQTAVVSLNTNNEFNFPFPCFFTRFYGQLRATNISQLHRTNNKL